MKLLALIGSTAGLLLAGAAYAEDAPAAAAPAQPEAPAATAPAAAPTFSEADVEKFANVLVAIDKIRSDYAASGDTTPINSNPEATAKMAAAVQESGLPFETYNAIAARMTADADLNHRIAQYMPKSEGASQ